MDYYDACRPLVPPSHTVIRTQQDREDRTYTITHSFRVTSARRRIVATSFSQSPEEERVLIDKL